jgi:hypothetical protein
MPEYLMSETHQSPPAHILADGLRHPVAPLIRREDIHRLSQLGVLRHITAEGPAPLGYGPWTLAEDAQGVHYVREPAGSPEQIAAALAEQEAAAHEAYLDGLECDKLAGELALARAGLLDDYEALLAAALPSLTAEQRVFARTSQRWRYRDPVLQLLGGQLGLSAEAMVALFEQARE